MDSKPVVVGIDGSADSVRALRWAAEYADRFGAPLEALTVYELQNVYGPYAMAGSVDSDVLKKRAHDALSTAVRDALGDEADVVRRVEQGHPAKALVTASREAQLVVVGSRGHGGFAGLLLGSVSQHCVTHASCPVIVLPHEGADEE